MSASRTKLETKVREALHQSKPEKAGLGFYDSSGRWIFEMYAPTGSVKLNEEMTLAEFTVVIGTARGAFELVEDAKTEAMKLARLNAPNPVFIEDSGGQVILSFSFTDEKMFMTKISQETVIVNDV